MRIVFFTALWIISVRVIGYSQPAIGYDPLEKKAGTLHDLAEQFAAPPDACKPHAWWHWMGSNFSKEGITKDLYAMKESGIGGVVVFNAPSWLNPEQNPWPQQTYRSTAYWDALSHTLSEAKKLDMVVGIHNTPGWATTGGPWISPEQGMQAAAFSVAKINGTGKINIRLPNPKENEKAAPWFKDVAVIAVPAHRNAGADDIQDLSAYFANGTLEWEVPSGEWTVYRFGYYPTMQLSHPAPEDVADASLEADKMSPEATVAHWNNVLNPLTEKFGPYIGSTFNYIWIDSYESWGQNWTPAFREEFIRMKGYDPVIQLILAYERGDSILNEETKGIRSAGSHFSAESNLFLKDYAEVVNRLFLNCWRTGKEMVNKAGFRLCFEPYGSIIDAPFDMEEGIGIADIPVTEFWMHSRDISGGESFAKAAAKHRKRIVGAEAFTGMERTCTFTETPAMLKRPADMGYSHGVNLYFLHSWVHNPLDDKYQPGWSFAHYGTHFSRNQTWFEPGKAFFTYLSRCQMLLQQGTYISHAGGILHRSMPEAEIFFVSNPGGATDRQIEFPVAGRTPELWDAAKGIIKRTNQWKQAGDKTTVTLRLEQDESVFVVFPAQQTHYAKQPVINILKEVSTEISGEWVVTFRPKTGDGQFRRKFKKLVYFSKQDDEKVRYFSGTAIYEKTINIESAALEANKRILIDLGELYDMAELEINGRKAGVLWYPPYRADISPYLKTGRNTLRIHVTNTWVNRLTGDEQYPEDFEWTDRNQGLRAMTGLPDWIVKGRPRPVKERKAFVPWYYFSKDSPLSPSGLLGPVTINCREISLGGNPSDTLSIYDLRCEYIKDPLGIDNPYTRNEPDAFRSFSPRISWKIAAESEAKKQTAYRIILADKPESGEIIWDSGIVEDNRQYSFIPGSLLRPGGDYYWKAGVFCKDTLACVWSEQARFSMGLREEDWQGQWINHPCAPKESHIWYRKEFTWPENKEIPADFFACIASSGYHELYINGEKVSNNVLAPAVSRIDKRILYVTCDIARLIRHGKNSIAIHYGPGWSLNNYFARQKTGQGILVQLYGGKNSFSLSSDTTWLCHESDSKNSGHFDFMDMGGELTDGRKNAGQWMKPGFDDSRWPHASACKMENRPYLSAQMSDPSQVTDTVYAVKLSEIDPPAATDSVYAVKLSEITGPLSPTPARKTIYRIDMGRQFTGFLEAGFEGLDRGDTVEIMISMRDTNPEFVEASYGIGNDVIEEQKQKQIYVARGEDGEKFRNRFNYFAGRYIHFRGLKKAPALQDIKGLVVSSAPEMTAAFECSDSLYNKIFALDVYTFRMCHTEGVVVDCPNRERLGYGPEGAYQTMWGLGLPCFNSSAYYIKNVRDWGDVQQENGFINNVAPQISNMYGCVLNGTAILNTAWEHYRVYGDKRILEAAWPVGKKWLEFLGEHTRDSMLTPYDTHGYFLGDWVRPGPAFEYAETEEALFFNNCAYAMALDFTIRIARELDLPGAEINRYAEKLNALRRALHNKYYRPGAGTYQNGDQVRTAFALYAGVVPDYLNEKVHDYLNELLRRQQYLNIGSFGRYPFYKTILANARYAGVIDTILAKKTYPGYGYFIEKGCTALPEMWEIDQPNSTVIHTSYTGISAFFIKALAGINEACAGSDTLRIEPIPVERLSWCKAATETPYGRVESAWERNGEGIQYTFAIPFGAVARIKLAGEEEKIVPSGHYKFQVKPK
jgi:alpha-L-rhamnosidase